MSTAPSGWQTPKTNWTPEDAAGVSALNRIEGNINAIENGARTLDPALPGAANTGTLWQILSWLAGRILAITGNANLGDSPATTLPAVKGHMDAAAPHSGHETPSGAQARVDAHASATAVHGATSAATANRIIMRDAAGRAKVAAPAAADDIARKDTVDAAQDSAIEEGLVIEAVLPVAGAEPEQVQASKGPAVQFANGVTQSVTWCRRFPFGSNACKVELIIAADVANAGSFRVRVAWQVNGGSATNVDVTVTPGATTNLYTADLGIIVPDASVAAGQLVTFTLSRLGADPADTHTGAMLVYHARLKRG